MAEHRPKQVNVMHYGTYKRKQHRVLFDGAWLLPGAFDVVLQLFSFMVEQMDDVVVLCQSGEGEVEERFHAGKEILISSAE